MKLIDVYEIDRDRAESLLFNLLAERMPSQSISHKRMPTHEEHRAFIESRPYLAWYFIEAEGSVRGSCYLSKQREIGIFLFQRYQKAGVGTRAVRLLMAKHPGKVLANVNPANLASARMFEWMGFKVVQHTYASEGA